MAFTKRREKLQERANLVEQARALMDKAAAEKRAMTAEEDQQYEAIDKDIDRLTEEIRALDLEIERRAKLNGLSGTDPGQGPAAAGQDSPGGTDPNQRTHPRATEEYRAAFERFLRSGANALTADEVRAMQADSDTGGGFLVAPQQMVQQLLTTVTDAVVIRQLATVFPVERAESLGAPVLNRSTDDAEWTAELKTGGQTEVTFGKRELRPHPLSKMALVSNKLMRVSAISVEQIVRDELSRIFAETMEKAYMTVDGQGKPLGIFTASADGISTARDVSTDNTTTAITSDGLIEAKFSLKPQYWPKARWIFHRDGVKKIRKLKDNDGNYIWMPGITGGVPDRILELAYIMSEFCPNTFTAGKYVGALGDFSKYWIADALDMQIQRLVELYALTNQTAFIGRLESDGAPVLEEAFVRVKLAAA